MLKGSYFIFRRKELIKKKMKLLYLWFNGYKCFNNNPNGFEMNFSEHNRFTLKPVGEGKYRLDKEIEDKEFENCSIFDKKSSIENISVLVGSNGAGKTSLIRLLHDIIFNVHYFDEEEFFYLIIFEIDGKLNIKRLNVEVENIEGNKIILDDNSSVDFFAMSPKCSNDFLFCYYSSFFSFTNPLENVSCNVAGASSSRYINISTTALLKDSLKKEHYGNMRTGVKYSKSLNNIDVAENIDFNSCIDFISKYNNKNTINNSKLDIGITVPENIIFLIDRNDEEFFRDEFGIEKDSENIISKIYKFLFSMNEAKAYNKGRTIKQNFLDRLGISIFCNYSRTYLKESNGYNSDEIYDIYKCLYDDDKIKKLEIFYKNTDCKTISEYLLKLFDYLGCENDEKKIIEFINFCISIDDKYFRCLYLEFYIDFNTTKDKEDIKKFFELYKNITKTSEFIRQRFIPNPSDGEYSTMIFYSRLYNEFNDNDSNKLLETKNLLLLIDEAEITMHPSLQQKFVKNLIDFFNMFLPKFKVQVIIATHSPVILSDIPKTNVIFLKKEPGSKSTSIVKFDSDSNTFLANYLELYKNSFFLEDGFIGHFARQKIKGLLSNIENGKFDNYDEYILSIIGEPILKKTLKDYCKIKKNKK